MTFLFFVGGEIIGGEALALRSLMSRLSALGHRVMAIVSVWNDSIYPRMLDDAGIDHHEIRLGRLYLSNLNWTRGTLKELPGAVRAIRRITADLQPDWVVFEEAQSLLLCSAVIRRPSRALYLHATPDHLMNHPLWGRLLARQVERTVCVSQFVAQRARTSPLRRTPIAVVHNGTDVQAFQRPHRERHAMRLGIVGRVHAQKQHVTLLRAIALLKARLPPESFHLDIVGAAVNEPPKDIEAEIARLGLERLVTRTGFIEDRNEIYGRLDIVVVPAVDEAFGLTAVEAGAYGLPVVAARSGGLPEIVVDGTTGLLFEPGNVEDLARSLERLIRDRDLRDRLGQAACARVRADFTMDKMAERFLEALNGRVR
jgi:glycosyltransferase involved in cell wall biosynthesis